MPIPLNLSPLEDLDPTVGFVSQMIIAEADTYADQAGFTGIATGAGHDFASILGTPSAAGIAPVGVRNVDPGAIAANTLYSANRGFHPVQPLSTDLNLMDEGENIPIPYYTGDAGDTKDASGPTTLGGNIRFPASGDGTELVFANLMQSLAPTHVARTAPGIGAGAIPAAITTVSSTALGTTSSFTSHTVVATVHASPASATIAFSTATRVAAGTVAMIEVTGTALDGSGSVDSYTEVTEQFMVPASGSAAPPNIITDVRWKTITAVRSLGFMAGDITVTTRDTAEVVTFEAQDNRLRRFWITEVAKGIVINVYTGVIITGMNFNFNRTSPVIFDTQFTGRRGFLYRDLNGREGNNAIKTAATGLRVGTTEVFTGWQCELTLNGVPAAITDATFTLAQNLQPTGVISRQRHEEVRPVRATRNVTIDCTVVYSPQNDFARLFRNNVTMNSNVNIFHSPFAGFPWRTSFQMPQAQIMSNPDAETPEGLLTQNIRIKSFVSGIGLGSPDDVRIVSDYSGYVPVREYALVA